jgi:hypothetical protein
MRITGCFILLACTTLIHGAIRPSFWLSRCAWEATDVLELAVAPGTAGFRVVATIKGATRPGAIKILPELMAPAGDHSLLKDLATDIPEFRHYQIAPPIRDVDRLIVFLRPGDQPAHWTMLTSAVWLQEGVAYVFRQTMNPGPTHLVRFIQGEGNEALLRADIGRLLRLRETFDHAVANPNTGARVAALAELVTSGDDVATRGALAKLGGEDPEAAHALLPLLNDEKLLKVHFQILDSIVATKARDIRLDSIIRREASYWAQTCRQTWDTNWIRNYTEPPAFHYLRLVSALKAIRTLGINGDLPAVSEIHKLMSRCQHLNQQQELVEVMGTLVR